MPVHLYILASSLDTAHREELEKQLVPHRELITRWSVADLSAGSDVARANEQQLAMAQLVVWLISPDFRVAEEQSAEARLALQLERAGALRIIPVLVRVTTHYAAPYIGRKVLPDNKVPVSAWADRDAAWAPDGTLFMTTASEIHWWRPGQAGWTLLSTPEIGTLSRLAISPDGRWMALVAVERP